MFQNYSLLKDKEDKYKKEKEEINKRQIQVLLENVGTESQGA